METTVQPNQDIKSNQAMKWILGIFVLIGVFTACIIGFVLLIFVVVFSAIRDSEVVQLAITEVNESAVATEALGSPVTAGWLIMGSVETSPSAGMADLVVPVSGPSGKGSLTLYAQRVNGVWQFQRLDLTVSDTGEVISLMGGR